MKEKLQFLPISINVTDQKILIIGGGKVAYHKATILNRFVDRATVVSPDFHEGFEALPFTLIRKKYEPEDLSGAFLVYICTENEPLNAEIKQACRERGILASVCDNPVLCDFISPAIHKKGQMTIAVSSNAQDVYRSIEVRNQIKELIDQGLLNI
ncbi:bifunctional precorrin-2 dehydrogenase/sirohydrochlorin ferrochelatase [Parabacteroides sp. Marseille-P3160]|uniref:precorrin-2 dehydrogenase/sirohydrochlorin ferrochelatase family protein n=1 Tax=Parabacteroides sp. Marseille-P3160 TaxID=1917887 RepID=UPI0009BADD5E|nr:bifunctional precorrin-2 dehydrogenase/sirohydrochlorin ferrochelatase [Parabacteroides sp. Marseille-P3160]